MLLQHISIFKLITIQVQWEKDKNYNIFKWQCWTNLKSWISKSQTILSNYLGFLFIKIDFLFYNWKWLFWAVVKVCVSVLFMLANFYRGKIWLFIGVCIYNIFNNENLIMRLYDFLFWLCCQLWDCLPVLISI